MTNYEVFAAFVDSGVPGAKLSDSSVKTYNNLRTVLKRPGKIQRNFSFVKVIRQSGHTYLINTLKLRK